MRLLSFSFFLCILFSCTAKVQRYQVGPPVIARPHSFSASFLSQLQADRKVNIHNSYFTITLPDSLDGKSLAWGDLYFAGNTKAVTGRSVFFIVSRLDSNNPTLVVDRDGDTDFRNEEPMLMEAGKPFVLTLKNSSNGKGAFSITLQYHNQLKDSALGEYYRYVVRSLRHPLPSHYYLRDQRMNYRIATLPDGNQFSLYDVDCNGLFNNKSDKVYAVDLTKAAAGESFSNVPANKGGKLIFANNTYNLHEVDPEGNWVKASALNVISDPRSKISRFSYTAQNEQVSFHPGAAAYSFLYFWGSWCPGCSYTSPIVDSLKKRYKGKIRFVELNHGDTPGKRKAFIEKFRLSFSEFTIDQKNIDRIGISGFPSYILLDKDGYILSRAINFKLMDSIANAMNIR